MRVLVTGWFSFDTAEVTAGDLLARDTAVRWLREAGVGHDVAVAANFRQPGDLALDDAEPGRYTDVLFVCGPAAGGLVQDMFARFPDARHLALDVSVVNGTGELGLDAVLARDSERETNPDLSLATPTARTPVIAMVLSHDQPEYGGRQRLADAHEALGAALLSIDAAPVQVDTRLHPGEPQLCSTVHQLESVLARVDAVVTTRMHGLVLALKVGVPALAIDPVSGGGKVSRQAAALDWPAVITVDGLGRDGLADMLRWCLSDEARDRARRAPQLAGPALDAVRDRFMRLLGAGDPSPAR